MSPFTRFATLHFGVNLPETEYLRNLFAAYAVDLFGVNVAELSEREVCAAYRAFTAYLVAQTGVAERNYVLPVDWARAMIGDNPNFIADQEERYRYLEWLNYLVVQGGADFCYFDVAEVGPVFLSSVLDVSLPGALDPVEPAMVPGICTDGTLYWCQTVSLRFLSHDAD